MTQSSSLTAEEIILRANFTHLSRQSNFTSSYNPGTIYPVLLVWLLNTTVIMFLRRAHLGSVPPGTAASREAGSCCCLFSSLSHPPFFPSCLDSLEVSSSAGTPKLLTHSTVTTLHSDGCTNIKLSRDKGGWFVASWAMKSYRLSAEVMWHFKLFVHWESQHAVWCLPSLTVAKWR